MGLGGLTKFLMSAETHVGQFRTMDLAQQRELILNDRQMSDKILLRDQYFDQVIVKETHNELLNIEGKKPMNIYSKPIPILPVEHE